MCAGGRRRRRHGDLRGPQRSVVRVHLALALDRECKWLYMCMYVSVCKCKCMCMAHARFSFFRKVPAIHFPRVCVCVRGYVEAELSGWACVRLWPLCICYRFVRMFVCTTRTRNTRRWNWFCGRGTVFWLRRKCLENVVRSMNMRCDGITSCLCWNFHFSAYFVNVGVFH